MDKLSLKVLKHIESEQDNVPGKNIVHKFGISAKKSLSYLEAEGYIQSGKSLIGIGPEMRPVFGSNDIYSITSKGMEFLEERPWVLYDKWSTRFFAIWGAITGTAALILEAVLHFL